MFLWRLQIVKKTHEGHFYSWHTELFLERDIAFQIENPQTQQINVQLSLYSLSLSILMFIFVFLNICPCVCVYSLTCDKCLVYSWVSARTSHMLTVFRYIYSIHIISRRWEENNSISIFTIWHQNDYLFFLATLRSWECWRGMGGGTELKRGGWVGRKQCYCTDTWMTKEKDTARLFFKRNVHEKAHSSWSHLTHPNKSTCH